MAINCQKQPWEAGWWSITKTSLTVFVCSSKSVWSLFSDIFRSLGRGLQSSKTCFKSSESVSAILTMSVNHSNQNLVGLIPLWNFMVFVHSRPSPFTFFAPRNSRIWGSWSRERFSSHKSRNHMSQQPSTRMIFTFNFSLDAIFFWRKMSLFTRWETFESLITGFAMSPFLRKLFKRPFVALAHMHKRYDAKVAFVRAFLRKKTRKLDLSESFTNSIRERYFFPRMIFFASFLIFKRRWKSRRVIEINRAKDSFRSNKN